VFTNDSNTSGFQDVTDSSHSSRSQPSAAETKNFAALVLHDSSVRAVPGFEPLLTIKEVAAILRVCRDTVYRLCAKGRLPHVRILNAIRIAPADLNGFLRVHRDRPSSE
jgi:excisionase family DNA binding protein